MTRKLSATEKAIVASRNGKPNPKAALGVEKIDTPSNSPEKEMSGHKGHITLAPPLPTDRKGCFTFTSRNDDGDLHTDKFNPASAANRRKFIDATMKSAYGEKKAEWPAGEMKALDKELMRWANQGPGTPEPSPVVDVIEVDVKQVVRPELFFTAQFSGLTLPVMTKSEKGLVPRWRTYLRWHDGRREVIDRPSFIELPDKQKVYIHPDPGEPAANEPPAWSSASRSVWLSGKAKVKPADLFKRICERLAYFLELDPDTAKGTAATIALWIMLTYVYPAWDSLPYLFIGGPMQSGKTRLLEILARLVFRPLVSANLTAPALFRTLHARGGTLIFDEAERLRQDKPEVQELNQVFQSGYRRGGAATRLEPFGDTFRTVQFEVFGPKVIACIAGLPPVLASRCITVMMFRAAGKSEKPKRRLDEDRTIWERLRDDLHILALENGAEWAGLAANTGVVPEMINGRDFELWQPLLSLAHWFESKGVGNILQLLQGHATRTVDDSRDDAIPDADEMLLEILAHRIRRGETPTAGEILGEAQEKSKVTFEKWHPATVTRRFKNYGIPTPKKTNGKRTYRNISEQLKRIEERYGIELGSGEGDAIPS